MSVGHYIQDKKSREVSLESLFIPLSNGMSYVLFLQILGLHTELFIHIPLLELLDLPENC